MKGLIFLEVLGIAAIGGVKHSQSGESLEEIVFKDGPKLGMALILLLLVLLVGDEIGLGKASVALGGLVLLSYGLTSVASGSANINTFLKQKLGG